MSSSPVVADDEPHSLAARAAPKATRTSSIHDHPHQEPSMHKRYLIAAALAYLSVALIPTDAFAAATPTVPGIEVRYEPCPYKPKFSSGCTYPGQRVVYVERQDDERTLRHELGHKFAEFVLGNGGLIKFARMTSSQARSDGGARRSWEDVGEQFADAYAACSLDLQPIAAEDLGEWEVDRNFPTGNNYAPTPRMQRAVCAMIVRAGTRAGL